MMNDQSEFTTAECPQCGRKHTVRYVSPLQNYYVPCQECSDIQNWGLDEPVPRGRSVGYVVLTVLGTALVLGVLWWVLGRAF